MPGFVTHYICGQSVIKKVDDDLKNIIKEHEGIYNIGTQGPDMFFYYLPGHLKKNTQSLGLAMHKTNTQFFIDCLIKNSREFEGKDKEIATAYVTGYLTHYALDANTHAYIYYKTGFRKKGDMWRAPLYSLYHRKFETSIDHLLSKLLSSNKTSKITMGHILKSDKYELEIVAELLSKSVSEAYGRDISKKDIKSSIKYMQVINKVFDFLPGGDELMDLVDDLSVGEHKYQELFEMQVFKDNLDYLNIGRNAWFNPWNNEIKNSESFIELYNNGVHQSIEFVKESYDCIYSQDDYSEFLDLVGNRSLSSGLDCELNLEWKFHDIIFRS